METPLVTILLATYNRAHLIGETLDSILAQTYTNWECIIIDDNSTDNTEEYLKTSFLNKDNRFSYYKKDITKYKKGLGGSRNQSLDIAKEKEAKYIHFFDDDDLMHCEKLNFQIKPFLESNNIDFTICEYEHLNLKKVDLINLKSTGLPLKTELITYDFITKNKLKINLNSCGPLWRSSFWSSQRFNEGLKTGEEYVAYSELFLSKEEIKYDVINYLLFFYRKHSNSNTASRYKSIEIKHSMSLVDELVFASILKNNKINYKFFSYFIRKHIIISFDYRWYKTIIKVLREVDFKGKYRLSVMIDLYIYTRKIFLKLI